ncbi:MAG: site-specific integrase [Clostridiales bacterium]|nr:site-specific integrase [Clostridiales bacterium]
MINLCIRKRFSTNGAVYEYRFEIASIDGKRKWKSKSGFKTVTEARKAGREAMRQYENYGHIAKDQISVADFFDIWFEKDCMVDLKETTLTHYKKVIDNVFKPKLGSYRLRSLTREVLQAFLVEMYDFGYSRNSLVSFKGMLTKSMNYAMDNHYIVCTPAVRLKIPKNRVPQVPTRSAPHHFIKGEVMQKIFERFTERSSSYIPLKLGYECGLRLGETFGLCWEDIDLVNKVIYINRQVQWYQDKERTIYDKIANNGSSECGNGYWYFSAPKYNSYRAIEISDGLAKILSVEKKRQEIAKAYYGIYYHNYYSDRPLVFDNKFNMYNDIQNRIRTQETDYLIHFVCIREDGTFISPRTMQHATKIIKKDICEEFDYHSLRHTHASILAESGATQKYIQCRLGHSKLSTTFEVYEHVTDDIRQQGRSVVNRVFS